MIDSLKNKFRLIGGTGFKDNVLICYFISKKDIS